MDLGYVATRPRFSRERRTWNVNVRNLMAEDVRALRNFRANVVMRGSLSFYFPNLLLNGGFEFAPLLASEVFAGWTNNSDDSQMLAVSNGFAYDGSACLLIESVSGQVVTAGEYVSAYATCERQIPVNAGDVYQFNSWFLSASSPITGLTQTAKYFIDLFYTDGSSTRYFGPDFSLSATSWTLETGTWTVPAPPTGKVIAYAQLSLLSDIQNATGAPITLGPTTTSVRFDGVGLALVSAGVPQIATACSEPIPVPVRFASGKLPKFSDLGWGSPPGAPSGGCFIFGATFALEEV